MPLLQAQSNVKRCRASSSVIDERIVSPMPGGVCDRLADRFSEKQIFMDIDTMKVGLDFVEQIEKAAKLGDVLIAVVGKIWVNIQNAEGHRQLDNPKDFIRIENQAALARNIPVIPLLVGGAGMPKAADLPDPIANLTRRHAMKMSDEQFRAVSTRLIEQITEYVTEESAKGSPVSEVPKGMVLIPKGPFLYGGNRAREDIPFDYFMDAYPVTNDHYKEFILANGYGCQDYWSDEGWAWKQANHVNRPEYWTDSKWNQADHPVVGVSYYEAEAYASCTGKRLSTEQEWERAARGTDGREYPWGDVFDKKKCNSDESGIEVTTPVTKYAKGISPSGCFDMAGNVWEWCASWYEQSRGRRVVRGGSWGSNPVALRASARGRDTVDDRSDALGFRLAQDIL